MIGGVRLTFSIEFNEKDKRTYIDKVSEMQEKIIEVIEEMHHNSFMGTGEPILKSEMHDVSKIEISNRNSIYDRVKGRLK